MAVYRTHVITKPETVQAIATQQLGDVTRWEEIVQLNDLVYPYIVGTNTDKMSNPLHLLTYGDKIYLPEKNRISDLDPDTAIADTKQQIYDMSLGMDLSLKVDYDHGQNGLNDGIAYLEADKSHHDIVTTYGIENLKQSIERRLLTRYGTLMYHPNYGSYMLDMIGQNITTSTVEKLKLEILRTAKTDGRVSNAKLKDFELDGTSFICILKITAVGLKESFEMFVERAQDGTMRTG